MSDKELSDFHAGVHEGQSIAENNAGVRFSIQHLEGAWDDFYWETIGVEAAGRVSKLDPLVIKFLNSFFEGSGKEDPKATAIAAQAQPMKVTSHETIDWTEISKRGLLERINREIMHPLGLAVYRCVETGVSGGALVSPDGVWTYEEDSGQAQQPVSGADGSDTERVLIDGTAYQVPAAVAGELLRLHLELHAAAQPQPSGNVGELPDAVRVPLDSLHADAVYLLSRVKQETLSIHDAALSIRSCIDSARAALAQQASGQDQEDAVAEVSQETFNSDGTSDIIKPALPIGMKLYARPASKVKA